IFAQVGHFYFGEVGQYYFGANKISNSRHSTAIFSPSSNRATNLSRSSIGRHSRHGICVPPQMPESVTYVSGINCYPSIRKGINWIREAVLLVPSVGAHLVPTSRSLRVSFKQLISV